MRGYYCGMRIEFCGDKRNDYIVMQLGTEVGENTTVGHSWQPRGFLNRRFALGGV